MKFNKEEREFIKSLEFKRILPEMANQFRSIYYNRYKVRVCVTCSDNFNFYLKNTIKLIKRYEEEQCGD